MVGSVRRIAGVATTGLVTIALVTIGLVTGTGTGPGPGVASAAQSPPPVARITNLAGVFTSVELNPGFVQALRFVGVALSPSGTATISDGRPKFPITGGNLTIYKPGDQSSYVQGRIEHADSGLILTQGDTSVSLTDFVLDPGAPAMMTGKLVANGQTAAESLKLFDLDGSTLKPIAVDPPSGTATLTGVTVTLSDEAAEALRGVFQTRALSGGTPIGTATILVDITSKDTPPQGDIDTGSTSHTEATKATEGGGLIVGAVLVLLAASAAVLIARRRPGWNRRNRRN